jgi:hypothetical protein
VNQHKRVVRDVLNHLYARISGPLASDLERHRIGLVALDQLAPDETPFSLDGLTVAQVQAAVEGKKVTVAQALEYELANANRKSLVAWLKERE